MTQLNALSVATIARFVEYDPETGEITWRPTRRHDGGKPACIPGQDGSLKVNVAGVTFDAGQVAWALARGAIPEHVERINGDLTDNRIVNLKPLRRRH